METKRPNNKEKRIAHIDRLLDRAERGEALDKNQKGLLREYFRSASGNTQRSDTFTRLQRIADFYGYQLDSYTPIQEKSGIFEKTGPVYAPDYQKIENREACTEGVPVFEATVNGVYMFVNTVPKGSNISGQKLPDTYEIYFPQIDYPGEHPHIRDQVLTLPDYATIPETTDGKNSHVFYGEQFTHSTIRAIHNRAYDTDREEYENELEQAFARDKAAKETIAQHVFEKACEIAARHVSKSREKHAEYVYLEVEKYIKRIRRGRV